MTANRIIGNDHAQTPAIAGRLPRPRFKIGAYDYEIAIVSEKPLDRDGDECRGIVDFYSGRIEIWQGVKGNRRMQLLLHELHHAWINAHRPASDEESRCDWVSHFCMCMFEQIERLGLFEILDDLPIEDRTDPT